MALQLKTIAAAAAILGASTAFVLAQNPTTSGTPSGKTLGGGGESSSGGSGAGPVKNNGMKAGSSDSSNNGSAMGSTGSGRGTVSGAPDPSKPSGRPLGTSGPKENRE